MAKVTYVRDDGERRPNSRLSCQLVASEALDGIVVHTPEAQL